MLSRTRMFTGRQVLLMVLILKVSLKSQAVSPWRLWSVVSHPELITVSHMVTRPKHTAMCKAQTCSTSEAADITRVAAT